MWPSVCNIFSMAFGWPCTLSNQSALRFFLLIGLNRKLNWTNWLTGFYVLCGMKAIAVVDGGLVSRQSDTKLFFTNIFTLLFPSFTSSPSLYLLLKCSRSPQLNHLHMPVVIVWLWRISLVARCHWCNFQDAVIRTALSAHAHQFVITWWFVVLVRKGSGWNKKR